MATNLLPDKASIAIISVAYPVFLYVPLAAHLPVGERRGPRHASVFAWGFCY